MNLDSDQKYYPTFFTATILEWKSLLANDIFKEIIVESLRYLVKNKKVIVYSFVIMPNHLHLVWQICSPFQYEDVQRDFLKFTAQQIKLELAKIDSSLLEEFYVGAKDREYQFWERKPLSTRLDSMELIEQKVNYIHKNPISGKWHLVKDFLDYRYSSARFYYTEESEFDFLTNYALAYCE